jgi:hypothetical protein
VCVCIDVHLEGIIKSARDGKGKITKHGLHNKIENKNTKNKRQIDDVMVFETSGTSSLSRYFRSEVLCPNIS